MELNLVLNWTSLKNMCENDKNWKCQEAKELVLKNSIINKNKKLEPRSKVPFESKKRTTLGSTFQIFASLISLLGFSCLSSSMNGFVKHHTHLQQKLQIVEGLKICWVFIHENSSFIMYMQLNRLLHLFAFENISFPSIFKCHSCGS